MKNKTQLLGQSQLIAEEVISEYDPDSIRDVMFDLYSLLEVSEDIRISLNFKDDVLKILVSLPHEQIGIVLIQLPQYYWKEI